MPQTRSNRILLWMCVLITVNQLGFGGIIPALALYARSFGVDTSHRKNIFTRLNTIAPMKAAKKP